MKSRRRSKVRLSTPLLRTISGGLLLQVALSPYLSAENPPKIPGEDPPGKECTTCNGVEVCSESGSMFWAMKVGYSHFLSGNKFQSMLSTAGRQGAGRGTAEGTKGGGGYLEKSVNSRLSGGFSGAGGFRLGGTSELDDMIQRFVNRSSLGVEAVMLESSGHDGFVVPGEGSGDLYVKRAPYNGPQAVDGNGNPVSVPPNGPILQIGTSTAFTRFDRTGTNELVIPGVTEPLQDDVDPAYASYRTTRVRTWASGGYPTKPPLHDVHFVTLPSGEMLIIHKETLGFGTKTTCEHRKTEGEVLTVTTHAGENRDAPVIKREVIIHSDRGALEWDYTLDRKTYEATTSANGEMGALVLTAHSVEVYGDYSPFSSLGADPLDPIWVFKGGDPKGRRLLSISHDPSGENLTTNFTYFGIGGMADEEKLGMLDSVMNPDGSWQKNEYLNSKGASAAAAVAYSSWKDLPITSFRSGIGSSTLVETDDMTKSVSVGSQLIFQTRGRKSEQDTILDIEKIYQGQPYPENRKYKRDMLVTLNTPQSLIDQNRFAGRPSSINGIDGAFTKYDYEVIDPLPGVPGKNTVIKRVGGVGTDGVSISGEETRTEYGASLEVISEETKDIATGLPVSSRTADLSAGLDNSNRPVKYFYNGDLNDYTLERHACCGLEFQRDRNGATTEYFRDALKRPYRIVEKASSTSPEVVTTITYNGLTTTTHRTTGGVTLFVGEVTKNLAGDVVERKSPDENGDGIPETTSYKTTYPGIEGTGNKTRTTTYPDGSTKIETWWRDGRIKSITGTAVPDVFYDYGTHNLNGGGLWTKVIQGSATGTEWTKTYSDSLEREFRIEHADGSATTKTFYGPDAPAGSRSKLATVTDADGVTVSYTYDSEGEIASITEPMPGGLQRITTMDSDVVNDSEFASSYRTRKWINGVLVSTETTSSDGRSTRTESLGTTTTWEQTLPVDGAWTIISTTADGQKFVRTYTEGRLAKSELFDNQGQSVSWTSWTYDGFGRILSETDSRTGTATRSGYTESGNLLASIDPGGRTTAWTYDTMGRTTAIDQPDTTDASGNPIANLTRTAYHLSGEIKAVWGDQTNPTYRIYDEQNRLTGLRTYRGIGHNVEPTDSTAGFDPTTWNYDPQRGWLINKRDATSKGADYTYSPAGRLATRQWARTTTGGARLTTTYGYDAGKLVSTTYNDGSTPNVSYAYDAFGRQTEVTQAGNSWTYTYDPATLLLDTETVTYDTDNDGNGDFTRTLDRSRDARLRPTGYQLKNGTTVETQAAYTYDDTGRLATVGDGTDTFTYGYVENSHLLQTVTGPAHTVTNEWDTTRDALLSKENKAGATIVSKYDYGVNAIGQRTSLAATGTAFSASRAIGWGYNERGEVISSNHSEQTQRRWYEYDAIGNREKSRSGTHTDSGGTLTSYVSNPLNQYASINALNPTYDADGNQLINDSYSPNQVHNYAWDGENRLIGVTTLTGGGYISAYRYDPFGRRIYRNSFETGTFYFYDGWNPVAEYDDGSLRRTSLWGQDLSGGLQGAGGVGGLLSTKHHGPSSLERFHPAYDGNGNVSQYLEANGAIASHFEYDPFGQVTVSTDIGNRFPIRFSTKLQDLETGLNYYGYRYYDPQQGRWLGRDLIQEAGGIHLYGFVFNDPSNAVDVLGLYYSIECTRCFKENGDFKLDCFIKNDGVPIHEFTANDYGESRGPSGEGKDDGIGNEPKKSNGRDGPLPDGKYEVVNSGTKMFGPNTPMITNVGKPGKVKTGDGVTKTGVMFHVQKRHSQGCITINDCPNVNDLPDPNPEKNGENDDVRSPHVNVIRNLLKKQKSIPLTVKTKEGGCCDKNGEND